MRRARTIAVGTLFLAAALFVASCSTTRTLQRGQYRLNMTSITAPEDSGVDTDELSKCVAQWVGEPILGPIAPGLWIYNLSDGSDRGINYFWKKIGSEPVIFDPDLVETSRRNIISRLQYTGWYYSDVQAAVDTLDKIATVDYVIKPGKRYPIRAITYDLPADSVLRCEFYADTANCAFKTGDCLSESVLEAESERSTAYFRKLGYYNFNKNLYSFEADTLSHPDSAQLRYIIRPYARGDRKEDAVSLAKYSFGNVTISHSRDLTIRESVLRRMNLVSPGTPYSTTVVNDTYERLSTLKLFGGISLDMTPADSCTVDCNIRLTESKLQGIKADLELSTNSSGLFGVSPQLSWYHKNIFHGGEQLTLGFTGNFQYRFSDQVSTTEIGVSSGLSFPQFFGLPDRIFRGASVPRTEIKAAYNYQDRPEYTRDVATLTFGYTWQTGGRHFFQVYPLQANFVNLRSLDSDFAATLEKNPYMKDSYDDHLDAGVGGTYYYTTNADIVPKTPYHYLRASLNLSGNVLSLLDPILPQGEDGSGQILGSPYTQYVRAEFALGRTWRLGKGDRRQFAVRALAGAGYAYGNSTSLPFEKQFYCGGASSMRGWQVRSLGPGSDPLNEAFSIPSQTGDFKLEFDAEYRFPMFWKVEGAFFAEAGNIWNIRNIGNILETIAADCGIGVRLNMDFILVRVDMGYKVFDPSAEVGNRWRGPWRWLEGDGFALHFGVGYPF